MTETEMIPCPISGCRQRCKTRNTLFVHVACWHKKNEVVEALVRLVTETKREEPRIPDGEKSLAGARPS